MKRVLVILVLGLAGSLAAQGEAVSEEVQRRDSAALYRGFDEAKWKNIVGDRDYSEREREAGFKLPSMPWAGPLLKIISYVVIIGLALWLLYYLIANIGMGAGIQRTAINDEALAGKIEDIESLDIEALLAEARRERNFRVAIRLYYLGMLKRLHVMGIIGWKKDKTNRDYLAELYAKDYHYADMRRLTVLYEAVWYGEHTPGAESFERLTGQFASMYEKINSPKTP